MVDSDSSLGLANFPPLAASNGTIGGRKENPRSGNQNLGLQKWSSIVSINSPSEDCGLERQADVLLDGNKGVSLSSKNFEAQTNDCKNLVIGFFAGRKLPFSMVKKVIPKFWKLKSEVNISVHGNNTYVFNFDNEEDRKVALDKGSFYMGKNLFIVRPWSLLIEQTIADMKTIPVWVLIYNVPLHLWNKLGLSSIATFLGNPLLMDEYTMKKTRLSYARVCVEVNFDCSFPSQIPLWIDGVHIMDLPVEYQWKPSKCSKCSSFGHTTGSCSLTKGKKKAHWTPKKKLPNSNDTIMITLDSLEFAEKDREPIPSMEVNNEVIIEVVRDDVHHKEVAGVNEVHPSAIEDHVQIAEKRSEDGPTELLWTYAKRNKNLSKKKVITRSVETCHLNPFDILFQDGELQEQGLVRVSSTTLDGNNESRECRDSEVEACKEDNRVSKPIFSVEEWNSEEDIDEYTNEESVDNIENAVEKSLDATDASLHETGMPIEKLKTLEEVSRYKPKSKKEHMEGLMKFSSTLNLCRGGKEAEVKDIFDDIVGVKNPPKTGIGLGPCNEELGRGKRTPVPNKKY